MDAGRGLEIALSRTITSATAVVMPEESGGALVRRLGRWVQDNSDAWASAVEDVNAQGVQLTISVNHEMLDDPRNAPDGLWRAFSIECWVRRPARTTKEIEQNLLKVGGPALSLALNALVEQDEVELPSFEPLPEGAAVITKVNRYERNPVNRLRCINHYGPVCWACELDFAERYGPAAAGFIEVHHRIPVSTLGAGYLVDPIGDLIPLCSNCHSVAHRRTPPFQPAEIRELLGLPPKVPALPEV
ncbi:HNH endonuclease [Pseudarthrobacter oxydans]|uniref:HNH endonuclease n=1 Tax=Pseudarthrobacter oxydans TaxID=1671 RepID=UPI00344B1229